MHVHVIHTLNTINPQRLIKLYVHVLVHLQIQYNNIITVEYNTGDRVHHITQVTLLNITHWMALQYNTGGQL